MLLKSRSKTIEEITKLPDKEVFWAYHKAVMSGDVDFGLDILGRLEPKRMWTVGNIHLLSLLKFMGLQMLLLTKASMAVSFYNSLVATILEKEYPKELYGKKFMEDRLKEIEELREKIKGLDTKAGGALELEEYSFAEGMTPEFDYWIGLGSPLIEKLKSDKQGSKIKQKGLELIKNN